MFVSFHWLQPHNRDVSRNEILTKGASLGEDEEPGRQKDKTQRQKFSYHHRIQSIIPNEMFFEWSLGPECIPLSIVNQMYEIFPFNLHPMIRKKHFSKGKQNSAHTLYKSNCLFSSLCSYLRVKDDPESLRSIRKRRETFLHSFRSWKDWILH